jgi:hypothetical protein
MRKYAGWPVLRTDLELIGSTGFSGGAATSGRG